MLFFIIMFIVPSAAYILANYISCKRNGNMPEFIPIVKTYLKACKTILIVTLAIVVIYFILKGLISWIGIGFIIFVIVFILIFG
ncbi:MAG: hypothetical protein J6O41_05855 [Clostridia bacterium]|nr:hypothetical protein [Clostridia bacterium]